MHQCASQCRGCSCVRSLVRVCVLVLPALAFCDLSRSRPPLVLASTVRFRWTEGGKGGSVTLPFLGGARVPGGCLLEAGQLRHLNDCLCNDLTALYV